LESNIKQVKMSKKRSELNVSKEAGLSYLAE
jgi:hypothetical protein